MKKNIKLVVSIIIIIICIVGIIFIFNKENKRINVENITLLNENSSKIVNNNNIYLNNLEVVIIVLLIFIILFIVGYLIYTYIIKSMEKKYIFISILGIIFVSSITSYLTIKYINNKLSKSIISTDYEITPKSDTILSKNISLNYKKYTTYDNNKNAIMINNNSIVELKNSTINKLGDTTDKVLSKVYGINSGILVLKDSMLYLYNTTINTNGLGASGIYSTLSNSSVNMDMVNIDTSGNNSFGISSSIGGSINGTNIKVKTSSSYSPVVMNNKGTIKLSSCILESNGKYSPIIDTNNRIVLSNCEGDSNNSSIGYIKDNSYLEINSSKFKVTGNKASNNSKEGGFIIKDSSKSINKNSVITINDSDIEIKKQSKIFDSVPMFNIDSLNTTINLTNNKFTYGSDIFLNINNNKKDIIKVVLNSNNQDIEGNITVDTDVNLEINLNKSTFNGSINSENRAKKIVLNISKDSKVILNNDIYVSVINNMLDDYSNIISNGYNIYYKKKLNSKTGDIEFKDGGKLINY